MIFNVASDFYYGNIRLLNRLKILKSEILKFYHKIKIIW